MAAHRRLIIAIVSHALYSEHIVGHGEKLLKEFCAANLEGVISKLAESRYV